MGRAPRRPRRLVRWRARRGRSRRASIAARGGPVRAAPAPVPFAAGGRSGGAGRPPPSPAGQPPGGARWRADDGARSLGRRGMPVCAAIGFVSVWRLVRRRRQTATPPLPGCQAIISSCRGRSPRKHPRSRALRSAPRKVGPRARAPGSYVALRSLRAAPALPSAPRGAQAAANPSPARRNHSVAAGRASSGQGQALRKLRVGYAQP